MEPADRYSQLLKEVFTTQQSHILIDALGHIIGATYDSTKNLQTEIKTRLPFDQTNTIVEIVKENQIDLNDATQAQEFFSELVALFKTLPTVDLTLAYSPTYSELQQFSQWWRKNFKANILLDITIDKNLIAGALIGYDGTMKDYSLHKVLGTYVEEKHKQ